MFDSIFTFASAEPITSETEEVTLIEAAREGDELATLSLLQAYGPALRSAVGRFSRSGHPIEDLQGAALVAFLELIAEHDPALNPRLAGRVSSKLAAALADEVSAASAFRVPERTLSRFYGILRNADGDVERAKASAPDFGMSEEVFLDVLRAVRTDSIDAEGDRSFAGGSRAEMDYEGASRAALTQQSSTPLYSPTPIADVEDRILVELAFNAVDDQEARICELAYGFTDYDPVPDAEIAHRLDLTRPTVQRKRGRALDKMRKALAVTPA